MADMNITGINEMMSNLQKLGVRGVRIENKAIRAGAEELKQTMEQNAPGPSYKKRIHLKDNIQMSPIKQREYGKSIEVGPSKENFYAHFLEFGTSKMSPQPFVEPSVKESSNRVLLIMADELKDGLGL